MELLKFKYFHDSSEENTAAKKLCEFVNSSPYIHVVSINGGRNETVLYYKIDDEATE